MECREFALFDIDNTIIKGDSMVRFIPFVLLRHPLLIFYIPVLFIYALLFVLHIISMEAAKGVFFYPVRFLSQSEQKEFFEKGVLKCAFPEMLDTVRGHRKDDRSILFVTASPEAYMRFFKEEGWCDEVIGTRLAFKNGRYRGKVIGGNCRGGEKVRRINEYLAENNLSIDFEHSYGYSDSKSDTPMLSLVKNRFRINKSGQCVPFDL